MKVLIDSNIIIYSLQSHQENLRKWMGSHIPVISAITQLEVLGYYDITTRETEFAKRLFSLCEILPIDQIVIQKAIDLRKFKQMSLGDTIIAATANVHELPLATANTKDFKHLEEVTLVNPMEI